MAEHFKQKQSACGCSAVTTDKMVINLGFLSKNGRRRSKLKQSLKKVTAEKEYNTARQLSFERTKVKTHLTSQDDSEIESVN